MDEPFVGLGGWLRALVPVGMLAAVGVLLVFTLRACWRLGWRLGGRLLGTLPEDPEPAGRPQTFPAMRAPTLAPEPRPALDLARMAVQAADRDYWRELNPRLHVEGEEAKPRPAPAAAPSQRRLEQLVADGYCEWSAALPAEEAELLRSAVERLHLEGWPPAFVFVYDEAWQAFRALRPMLSAALGGEYRHLPEFWAWRLDPRSEDSGWKPHRDKDWYALFPDGRPKSLTAWIALSDSTPANGCIYVLPASRDPNWGLDLEDLKLRDVRDVRALPAAAGTALFWNQALMHWGGRASPYAEQARVSLSFEFQRGDVEPLGEPLLDPQQPPAFEHRLRLIALQIEQYRHMHSLPQEHLELARRLQP